MDKPERFSSNEICNMYDVSPSDKVFIKEEDYLRRVEYLAYRLGQSVGENMNIKHDELKLKIEGIMFMAGYLIDEHENVFVGGETQIQAICQCAIERLEAKQ